MNAIKLTTDEDIKKAYQEKNIYFREGNEGEYSFIAHHTLDTILDATSHGFEFIATDVYVGDYLFEEDITFDSNNMPESYDYD